MDEIDTPVMQPVSAVMLVGLGDVLARVCEAATAPIACMRVGHVAAALERMLVVRPLLLVVDAGSDDELGELRERARDVGSVVVEVSASDDTSADRVRAAVLQAEIDRRRASVRAERDAKSPFLKGAPPVKRKTSAD